MLAEVEEETGARRAEDRRRHARGDDLVEFGHGKGGAAMFGQEAHQGEDRLDRRRSGVDAAAQMGLGLVELAARDVPAHQRLAHLRRVGEARHHVDQALFDRRFVAERREHGHALGKELAVLRFELDRGVDLGQRLCEVLRAQEIVDHHPAQQDVLWQPVAQAVHALHRIHDPGGIVGLGRRAVIGGGLQGEKLGIVGPQLEGGGRVAFGHFPVAVGHRHLGQGPQRLGVVGMLFDQPEVLREGFAEVAAVALDAGIGTARLLMLGVELEDVAELDKGAVDVTAFEIGHAGQVELLRTLLRAVAGRERRQTDGRNGRDQNFAERHQFPRLRFRAGSIEDDRGANMATLPGKAVFARKPAQRSIQ